MEAPALPDLWAGYPVPRKGLEFRMVSAVARGVRLSSSAIAKWLKLDQSWRLFRAGRLRPSKIWADAPFVR